MQTDTLKTVFVCQPAAVLLIFFLSITLNGCASLSASNDAPAIHAGVAVTNITPPEKYSQYRGESTGALTPLKTKAIVFEQGNQQAALVVCDLIRITRDLSAAVRTVASQKTSIPYSNIIVTATHTHTGPAYRDDLAEYVRKQAKGTLTKDDRSSYPAQLIHNVAQAVIDAQKAVEPVQLQSVVGQAKGISFNRRFLMKDGRVLMNPGVENPNIVRPVGPIDPDVTTLMIRQAANNGPMAALTVFANHLDTVGGTKYSADYPYYMAKALKEELGEEFVSVFGLGTCGDINHVDVSSTPSPTTQKIGQTLAQTVSQNLPNLKSLQQPSLAMRSRTIHAPMQEYSADELTWAKSGSEEPFYHKRRANFRRFKILSLEKKRNRGLAVPPTIATEPWTLPLEVQVIRLSADAAVVAIPGEVFVELGLAIKKASPFAVTQVIELANSNVYYVPTRKAFQQGSYETINSRIAPGGGEMLVDTANEMLEELYNNLKTHN